MLDNELLQIRMLGETIAAAVAKSRADLSDIAAPNGCAAQGAMGVQARGAAIDNNEAEHIGPPLVFPNKRGMVTSPPLQIETDFAGPVFP